MINGQKSTRTPERRAGIRPVIVPVLAAITFCMAGYAGTYIAMDAGIAFAQDISGGPTPIPPGELPHISGAIEQIQKEVKDGKLKEGLMVAPEGSAPSVPAPAAPADPLPAVQTTVQSATAPQPDSKAPAQGAIAEQPGKTVFLPIPGRKLNARENFHPAIPPEAKEAKYVVMNFEAAEIADIIVSVCDLLGMNYIIEPGVSGKVTVHTARKVPVEELFGLFEQLMAVSNVTVVKIGDFYRFVPLSAVAQKQLPIYFGTDIDLIPKEDRMIIQIIPLRYISASTIQPILQPFMSQNGKFVKAPHANILMAIDLASNMPRVVELVTVLDVNTLDTMQVQLIPVRNARVEDVVKELKTVFGAMGYGQGAQGAASVEQLAFVPVNRLNSILLINPFQDLYPTIKSWVEKLDQPLTEGESATYVYNVQNGDAADLAGVLMQLYRGVKQQEIKKQQAAQQAGQPGQTGIGQTGQTGQPGQTPAQPQTPPAPSVQPQTQVAVSGDFAGIEGDLDIVPHPATNSLLIRTSPRNYRVVLETLKRLDLAPMQVMIEALVAEVTLSDDMKLGVEWALSGRGSTPGVSYGATTGPKTDSMFSAPAAIGAAGSGISFFMQETGKLMAFLNALANQSKLSIKASPTIMTSENKSASINITDAFAVPVQTPQGNNMPAITTYQYKDVGIKLNVTPKINEDKFVTLDVSQEYSQVKPGYESQLATNQPAPTVTRQAQTSVIVRDNETLVIGGLIREVETSTKGGIPGVYKIPLLGWLFGGESKGTAKTELLIFLTPHVVTNTREARIITEEYQQKLDELKLGVFRP